MGEGLIDLVLRREAGAVVEGRVFRPVHLEEVETVHPKPLMDETAHEIL